MKLLRYQFSKINSIILNGNAEFKHREESSVYIII
jgi:hypothetical protein